MGGSLHLTEHSNMKYILALALLATAAYAMKGEKEDGGICIDEETAGAICMLGSGLEEKYMAAMMTCMGDGKVVTGRQGKGNGKSNGKTVARERTMVMERT